MSGIFSTFDLSLFQYLAFPVLLLLFANRLPRWCVLISILGATTGAYYSFAYRASHPNALVMGRFENDPYEMKSRSLREQLDRQLGRQENLGTSHDTRILRGQAEIEERFSGDPSAKLVVWGTARWLNVSFPRSSYLSFLPLVRGEKREKGAGVRFEPIQYVPIIGLSFEPERITAHFLAMLYAGLFYQGQYVLDRSAPNIDEVWGMQETLLRDAATMIAPWSSNAHLAYPWFILGLRYFQEAFRDGRVQPAEIDCALESFDEALGNLRYLDNQDLRAAALNNKGMLLVSRGMLNDDADDLKEARQLLKRAFLSTKVKNIYGLPYLSRRAVQMNLKKVKRLINPTKVKRAKKKSGQRKKGKAARRKK